MAGDLHRHHLRPGVEHPAQQRLQLVGLRSGVRRLLAASRPARLHGPDQTGLHASRGGDLVDQIRGGGLPVGAGHPEERKPAGRLAMKPRRGDRERPPRIGGDHHRDVQIQRSRGEDGRGAALHRLRCESGAIRLHAGERREERSWRRAARVHRQRAHLHLGRARRHDCVYPCEQLPQQHPSSNASRRALPPEYDGYPGGARVTFTLAPRLTIAPARGDCATARPLPRSSGSREACASLCVAVRAPRPETSGTTACPAAAGTPAASPVRASGSSSGESAERSSGAVSFDCSGITSSCLSASCAMAPHAGAATVPPVTSAPFPSGSSMTTRMATRGASAGAKPRKLESRLSPYPPRIGSTFCAVPVLPATRCPTRAARVPVPFWTTSSSISVTCRAVSSESTRRTSSRPRDSSTVPSGPITLWTR